MGRGAFETAVGWQLSGSEKEPRTGPAEAFSSLPYLADRLSDRPCELPTHSQLPTCPLGRLALQLVAAAEIEEMRPRSSPI